MKVIKVLVALSGPDWPGMLVGSSIPKILKGCSRGPQNSNKVSKRTVKQEEKKGKETRKGNFRIKHFRIHEKKHGRSSREGPQTRGVRKSNVQSMGPPNFEGKKIKFIEGAREAQRNRGLQPLDLDSR